MRPAPIETWRLWNQGGPFVGPDASPHAIVTVEENWHLNLKYDTGLFTKPPIRWWHREDGATTGETEIPHIKSIDIDRSLDTDAATCTISLYNTRMRANMSEGGSVYNILGKPGFYSWRSATSQAIARWADSAGAEWVGVLTPDALIRCVDTETEIMTRRGWLRWDEVVVGDETIGINPATGLSEWQIIEEVFSDQYRGEMLHLKSRVHDSVTTPNHRWLLKKTDGTFDWKTSDTLNTRSRIPLSAPHLNTNIPIYSDDFVELAAWYYTEGTAEHRLRSMDWGGNITQSEKANPLHVKRIRALFNRLFGEPGALPRGKFIPQELVDEAVRLRQSGLTCQVVAEKLGVSNEAVRRWGNGQRRRPKNFKWEEAYQGPVKIFKFTQEVARPLRKVICGPDKVPSVDFLNSLTQQQLEIFIDVSLLGDGTDDKGYRSFIQCHRGRSDAFEYACVLAGKAFHTTPKEDGTKTALLSRDVVNPVDAFRQQDTRSQGATSAVFERVKYNDIVWCPRVQHANWLARRNGSSYYTGNTYQGYGGLNKTRQQAIADGNLVLSGVWLVDTVRVSSNGMMELRCRDMAKLLIEQHLYPPVVPADQYPQGLRYCRYRYDKTTSTTTIPSTETTTANAGEKRCTYEQVGGSEASASDCYQGFNGAVYGHHPGDAFDGDDNTYWLSTGNGTANEPYAVEWIEAACGDFIDTAWCYTWGGNYRLYVSVMENGNWVDEGAGTVDYDPAGVGIYTGANTASIPYVLQIGTGFDAAQSIRLPRVYRADKVRFTFSNLYDSGLGDFPYRAGVRGLALSLSKDLVDGDAGATIVTPITVKVDGNYRDYAEIAIEFALWAGFELHRDDDGAQTFGDVEATGIADTGGCLSEDIFDKKPIIDGLRTLKEIVGFLVYVDEVGGFHFHAPNWFQSGNYLPNGTGTSYVPNIDEKLHLSDYTLEYTDKSIRSEIIISSAEPTAGFSNTVTTRYIPGAEADILRGITKPMALINHVLTDPAEQLTYAKLISQAILASTYVGQLTCAANPCISLNDQVMIHERITAETGIHYIRGIRTSQDLDTGQYFMTMTTFRIGDDNGFIITPLGDRI